MMARLSLPRAKSRGSPQDYEPVIGLEIHVQLKTKSKMFCRCSSEVFGEEPNSHTCPVCLGLPGALPVTNNEAVRLALLAGETFGSKHPPVSKFDRKNYFYPDLPKGYQISQYDLPLNIGGEITVGERKITLTRAHLEEDTGKLLHQENKTLIDFNRSGIPLLEVVTDPVIASPEDARAVGAKVQQLLRFAGVSEADMEKGSLRIDANVSLRQVGSKRLGTKVEVKNMNSFRSVERALTYEVVRQTEVLTRGERIVQETRGWDEGKEKTTSQRVKEGSEDYRYFPEPDLPAMTITAEMTKDLKNIAEERSPDKLRDKLMEDYKLSLPDAEVLTSEFSLQGFFTQALADINQIFEDSKVNIPTDLPRKVTNWLTVEYLRHFRYRNLSWEVTPVTPAHLAELIYLFDQGKVSAQSAKSVLAEMFETGTKPSVLVERRGLSLQSDIVKLRRIAAGVIAANPAAVKDYKAGKVQVLGFLLGQVQKETGGQADPTTARQALEELLAS